MPTRYPLQGDIAKAIAAGASTVMMARACLPAPKRPGRGHPLPGPQLQELPRHGFHRRHASGQCWIRCQGSDHRQPNAAEAECPKASKAGCPTGAAWSLSSSRWPVACAPPWATAAAPPSRRMNDKAEFVEITRSSIRESHVHDVADHPGARAALQLPGRRILTKPAAQAEQATVSGRYLHSLDRLAMQHRKTRRGRLSGSPVGHSSLIARRVHVRRARVHCCRSEVRSP